MEQAHTSADGAAPRADADGTLWANFVEAPTVAAFCRSWLAIQCRQVGGVRGAAVLLESGADSAGEGGASYLPVAVWPDVTQPMAHLSAPAQTALDERRGVVIAAPGGDAGGSRRHHIAYPIEIERQIAGVAVLEVEARPDAELTAALRQLHWGSAWLVDLFRRRRMDELAALNERLGTVLDLVALAVEKTGYRAAATAVVTELAARFDCERVSLGFRSGRHAVVDALSHSAHFKRESNLLRDIGAALDEAIDQRAGVFYPAVEGSTPVAVIRAARELCTRHENAAVAVLAFPVEGEFTGALCLERAARDRPFSEDDAQLLQAAAALAGPVLDLARRNDRPWWARLGQALKGLAGRLGGPGHPGWKLGAAAAALVVLVGALATGTYRVSGDAALEGAVQTAVVAPFSGYVAEANARPGDVVAAGEVLAELDDRDLRLERLRWISQRDEIGRQLREARATRDLAQIRILEAQLGQAEAQYALIDGQLARTRLVAPYEGVVIEGDLSQSLGAPVERGEVLFEVAPLDAYRLVVQVDDRDILEVASGMTGTLTLAALPGERFAFEVERLTPVATAAEGRNTFRVEAALTSEAPRLRPGMSGVAKIAIGERRLVYIWTHRLVDWWRLASWSWLP